MNAVAKHAQQPQHVVVAGVAMPARSAWLADALQHVAEPHPDVGVEPERIRPGVRDEAARALSAMDVGMRTATADEWLAFLLPFAVLPKAPQGRDALRQAVGPIAFALAHTPAAVLTPDLQREGLRRFEWWPTPAKIADLLEPSLAALRREREMLRRVVMAPQVSERDAPTPDQRAGMAAQAAALAADLRAAAAERDGTSGPARAVPLSDAAMLAHYERLAQDGNKAARFRADALKLRLGA